MCYQPCYADKARWLKTCGIYTWHVCNPGNRYLMDMRKPRRPPDMWGHVMPVCQTYARLWLTVYIRWLADWLGGEILSVTENSSLLLGLAAQTQRMNNERWTRMSEWMIEWVSESEWMNKCEDLPPDICKDTTSLTSGRHSLCLWTWTSVCRGLPRRLENAGTTVRQGACWGGGEDLMLQGPSEEKTALLQWEVGSRVTPTRISAWGLRLRTPASNIVVSAPDISRSQFLHLYNEEVCPFQLW